MRRKWEEVEMETRSSLCRRSFGSQRMNKADFINETAKRVSPKKGAQAAVDEMKLELRKSFCYK
jgi:hypothetical protein